ncbi:MAG: twin-arginine translocase TatA/TatE family subunit [Alphaproteobacteria bacterium]|nr:twin-arginine translocase TatA/TatE family subunit [Alphaproteobacteria bacterium]
MGSFSLLHWLIVLFVVLLLFGSRRLPNLMTDLASAVRAFRKGLGEEGEVESPPQAQSAAPKQLTNVTPPDAAVLEVQAVAEPAKRAARPLAAKAASKPAPKSASKADSKPKPSAAKAASAKKSTAAKPTTKATSKSAAAPSTPPTKSKTVKES